MRAVVEAKIDQWNPVLKRLVREADETSLTQLRIKTMLPIQPWSTSQVTLLGDAVHNMSPLYGMGANMALHDAEVLYNQLVEVTQGKPLLKAIADYEELMRTNGFKAVELAVGYTHQAISENRLLRLLNRNWMRLCNRVSALRKMTFGNTWKGDL